MKLRVGCVSYINAFPFSIPITLEKISSQAEWIYDIPSRLNSLLKEREIDIALTSCVEALEHRYLFVPSYGIAACREVLSVNLYTQHPLSHLNGLPIAITHHSATSLSLLKILCTHLWQIEPYFIPLDQTLPITNYSAFLLIGDEGLKYQTIEGFQRIDLAAAWHELTASPFIFALFAVRMGLSISAIATFRLELQSALEWSFNHWKEIEEAAYQHTGIDLKLIRRYYSLLQYQLGKKEMAGFETFKRLREKEVAYAPILT